MFSTSCLRLCVGLSLQKRFHGIRLAHQYFGLSGKKAVGSAVGGICKRHELIIGQRYASSSATNTDDLGKQIYYGPIATRIRTVKLFCLMTSSTGVMFQPILIQKLLEGDTNLAVAIFSGIVIQFFTFVTPFLLHYVTKRYVRTIYYNSKTDDYTALTYSFWTTTKTLTFKTEDVVVPDIPGLFTSVIIKGAPLFIEGNYFDGGHHYKRIMGYDKPIDFKLDDKSTKE